MLIQKVMRRFFSSTTVPHGTTILCVRKGPHVVMLGDGQVTLGHHVMKPNAVKVRRIVAKDSQVLAGFAGATADAMTLVERLESMLDQYNGQLLRSCVELAKAWRTEKFLRKLEATLLVADERHSLTITGHGDVIEPSDGLMAVGSGGPLALSAAKALYPLDQFTAEQLGRRAMEIAADVDIYTNGNLIIESLDNKRT